MRRTSFPPGRTLLFALVACSFSPLYGCNDDSRTTGTMVEVSDEVKAFRKSKMESYKGGPPKAKGKGVAGKK